MQKLQTKYVRNYAKKKKQFQKNIHIKLIFKERKWNRSDAMQTSSSTIEIKKK